MAQLDDLNSTRITRILTNDFPQYFAIVTRVRQEVHAVGPDGGMIISTIMPKVCNADLHSLFILAQVQAIFPEGSLTKTIKVSLQAQVVPPEVVQRLHGNRVAVSPIGALFYGADLIRLHACYSHCRAASSQIPQADHIVHTNTTVGAKGHAHAVQWRSWTRAAHVASSMLDHWRLSASAMGGYHW